ncbi:MAG: hypothetical protein Q7S40_26070 [Opitutaceae bacterium]|nr:hypothetical protein [Opitutaceae bacterium]
MPRVPFHREFMAAKNPRRRWAFAIAAAIIVLPLVGAVWSGRRPAEFFVFPPRLDVPRDYPRFSWIAAGAVIALLAAIAGSWLRHASRSPIPAGAFRPNQPARRFPLWGWAAVGWTLAWWFIAWTRLQIFEPIQLYTFFPLWFGFIVTVNALIEARAGTCLMRRTPAGWLKLFAVSAAFWWMFEWLNRFVHNWHYLAVESFGPFAYAAHATLCFSTVLPAVAAVRELLATLPRLDARITDGPAWPWLAGRATGLLLISGGMLALLGTGVRPADFYPALWLAPLALWWGAGILSGAAGVPDEIARGNWHRAAPWMLAALACGFWWELWNWLSLAKWIYTVPYVDRWHVFEMPLLGYAGYLSFGLECLAATEFIGRNDQSHAGD